MKQLKITKFPELDYAGSESFPRLVTSTLTAQIHAASSMQVVRLMDFLLLPKTALLLSMK